MGKFSAFMKQNKEKKENEKYAPTRSLVGSDGKPLRWEFKHLNSKENAELREKCTVDKQVTGKPNMFWSKLLSEKYIVGMIVKSTVYPDLYDAELQDSYGVKKPEDLVYEMVDDPGEFAEFAQWIQKFNGFDETLEDKVEEAKN